MAAAQNEDKITSYIDLASTGQETTEFLDQMNQVFSAYKKLSGSSAQLGGSDSIKTFSTNAKQAATDTDALSKAKQRLADSETKLSKEVALTNIQIAENNAANKLAAQLENAVAGSREEAKLKVKDLGIQLDHLNVSTEAGRAKQAEIIAQLDKYNAFITANSDAQVRQARNVGNYSGALKILESALADVRKKMDDHTKAGTADAAVMDQLSKQAGYLETLVDTQSQGFASATSEIKNNQKAIIALSEIYGKDSAVVQQLISDNAKLTSTVDSLKSAVRAQASDTHVFDGLISAAQGLTGAYSVAQGAAALFGKDNEALQETFTKLQAAMTILQGLQAVQAVLSKENAARQLINVGLQKLQTLGTSLQTAAESKNIVVRYLAIAAQKALNAVMAAAGGPIGIIIAAIGLLLISLSAMAAGNENVRQSLERLNSELEAEKTILDDNLNAIAEGTAETESELKKSFATEADIRANRLKGLQQEKTELDAFVDHSAVAYEKALGVFTKYSKEIKGQKLSESQKKDLEEAIKTIDNYEAATKLQVSKLIEINIARNNNDQAAIEERAKLSRAEIANLITRTGTQADQFNRVASDETKSYAVRRQALINFTATQQRINDLAEKEALKNPALKSHPEEITKIQTDALAKQIQIRKTGAQQLLDLDRTNAERVRAANFDIVKTTLQAASDGAQAILDDDKQNYADRLTASVAYYTAEKNKITGQTAFDLTNIRLNEDEKKAIVAKGNADQLKLKADFNKKINDLVISQLDKETQDRLNADDKLRDEAITALNVQYSAGVIGLQKYNAERLKLEKGYAIESLTIQIQQVQKVIAVYKALGYDVGAQEKQLAELQKNLSQQVTDKKISDLEKLKAKTAEIGSKINDAFSAIGDIVSATVNAQKDAIQSQIDGIDKTTASKTNAVNQELLSESDKQIKIDAINKKADAAKAALTAKQNALDDRQAQFDKERAITKIAIDTAVAVIAALPNIPLSIAVGLIGAAELAAAVAQPVPHHKDGRLGGPATWAVVGDGGRSEVVHSPDYKQSYITPATSTLTYLPKDWGVSPSVDAFNSHVFARSHKSLAPMPIQTGMTANDYERIAMQAGKYIVEAINGKQESHYSFERGEFQKAIKKGNSWTRYIQNNI